MNGVVGRLVGDSDMLTAVLLPPGVVNCWPAVLRV